MTMLKLLFMEIPLLTGLLFAAGCHGADRPRTAELDQPGPAAAGGMVRAVDREATDRKSSDREEAHGVVVVELFTSEGCSSCPPADALLSRLATESGPGGAEVIPLSMHVDYWNRLGWRDPFSDRAFSDRQGAYAQRFGLRSVYTPQVVVNGATEVVGSNEAGVRKAIGHALETAPAASVTLGVASGGPGDGVSLSYEVRDASAGSSLMIAVTERDLTVRVPRGENAGRTLRHDNVVRSLQSVPLDADAHGVVTLSLAGVSRRDRARIVAFVQNRETLRIEGAAVLGVVGEEKPG